MDEYYLHLFASEQPDLNWDNPAVVREVHNVMEFWLEKGVDGFRMDVINFISKEPGLPNAPVTYPDSHTRMQSACSATARGSTSIFGACAMSWTATVPSA